ncbi:hypothetical protein [Duganella callida]|uniref:DUF3828 domain-containing protein n=1 Tax=Duganella callida TaxID=2561932 RepID=A0A4Y9RWW9_9BURK|nr:hypothetical protein [Duganella callida]TFW13640.1 hypothetical protein E4L98_28760 [Duganella callida]
MRYRLMLALCVASTAARAEPCSKPDAASLQNTWQAFRTASLQNQPEQIARFYRFPLKLLPPMDGAAPLQIERPVFLKNYAALFQKSPAGDEIGLLAALKQSGGKEYIPQTRFDEARCRYISPTRVGDYNFIYDKKTGWQIESLYYGSDIDIARSAGLDR